VKPKLDAAIDLERLAFQQKVSEMLHIISCVVHENCTGTTGLRLDGAESKAHRFVSVEREKPQFPMFFIGRRGGGNTTG